MKTAAPGRGAAEGADQNSQLAYSTHAPRPQEIDDLDLRQLWWSIWRHGQCLPAQRGLILLDGGINPNWPRPRTQRPEPEARGRPGGGR